MTNCFTIFGLVICLLPSTVWATSLTHTPPDNPLTEQDLLADVVFFDEILTQKIEMGDVQSIRLLLPWYIKTPEHSPILLHLAQALIAKTEGDLSAVIDHYEHILAIEPNLSEIRFWLWQAHQKDGRYLDAKQTKDILLADEQLPSVMASVLQSTQNTVTKSFGVNYIKDNNINNAPRETKHNNWELQGAKKAVGVGYHADTGMIFTPANHLRIHPSIGVFGKRLNDKAHNDNTISTTVATSYQNSDTQLQIAPYYQTRHFAGRSYSDTLGIKAAINTSPSDTWHTSVQMDYASLHHKTRPFLDGRYLTVGATVGKQHTSNHWQTGMAISTNSAKDDSESYQERSAYVSLVKDWGVVGSAHRLGVAQRRYGAPDFFNITRNDTRYSTSHSLWHNKLHYKGFSPSINWQWEYTDSNHFAYKGKSQRLFLEVNKRF